MAFFAFLFPIFGWSHEFADIPAAQVQTFYARTEDGADLKLIRLPNPGKPIILLEPGLGVQGLSLELPAQALWMRADYDVYIGNWRGSAELPKGMSPYSRGRNGLVEIVRQDFPAHLRFILDHLATAEQKAMGITLLGHSMGGIMIMGALSDPKFYAEMRPYLRAIIPVQSPRHGKYLPQKVKKLGKLAPALIAKMRAWGFDAIDVHTRTLEWHRRAKNQGSIVEQAAASVGEKLAMLMVKIVLSPAYSGRKMFRQMFFKMSADKIALDVVEDFARSLNTGGVFTDREGNPLINAAAIKDIPVLMVRSELDTLAPVKEQEEYFEAIASPYKWMLHIPEMNHIDTVLTKKRELDFYQHIFEFLKWSERPTPWVRRIQFEPDCDSWLTRLKWKFRFRGL